MQTRSGFWAVHAEAGAHFWAERLNGLLFSLHDVRQGGIARLVEPQISCDDCWQSTQECLQTPIYLQQKNKHTGDSALHNAGTCACTSGQCIADPAWLRLTQSDFVKHTSLLHTSRISQSNSRNNS